MLTNNDLKLLELNSITKKAIGEQIENFKKGFPFLDLKDAAIIGKGISKLNTNDQAKYINYYNNWTGERVKFVPASGAATRMFKDLYESLTLLAMGKEENESTKIFFTNLNKFAFFNSLKLALEEKGKNLDDKKAILETLLSADGLEYGSKPKGLLEFHKYKDGVRTALDEHLVEGALYCAKERSFLHFTVSPEHKNSFKLHLLESMPVYEKRFNIKYNISFSEQKSSTNTIAVDMDNKPFRKANGEILLRPAGHGALIENLDVLKEELIFIKNIDNVASESYVEQTIHWKKIIAGMLISVRDKSYEYLKLLDTKNTERLKEISDFIKEVLCVELPEYTSKEQEAAALYRILDRPLRVCGMVKNEGEPGGGPFIAKNKDGLYSLQIVESSQIDLSNPKQKAIFDKSTHFNPVDLVCSVYNHKGEKYNLLNYRDPLTGFISIKTQDGLKLKAQELPGLWNGAMSNWNTIFVETPIISFNPVKTVNDLLKREHQ